MKISNIVFEGERIVAVDADCGCHFAEGDIRKCDAHAEETS